MYTLASNLAKKKTLNFLFETLGDFEANAMLNNMADKLA